MLKNKVAVVTGAARGIGRATAVALAHAGANIVGIDICAPICKSFGVLPSRPEELHETGKMVEAAGSRFLSIILDQRDLQALRSCYQHPTDIWRP